IPGADKMNFRQPSHAGFILQSTAESTGFYLLHYASKRIHHHSLSSNPAATEGVNQPSLSFSHCCHQSLFVYLDLLRYLPSTTITLAPTKYAPVPFAVSLSSI